MSSYISNWQLPTTNRILPPIMPRIGIFANPIAGKGRGRRLAESLRERFERQGWSADVFLDHPGQAGDKKVEALTAAVSIGGDGTLRSVVERLTHNGQTAGPGVLIVPMGTANLMSRHLGIALGMRDVEERAVRAIAARNIAPLDMAMVNGRIFLLVVGVGIDGAIVHALHKVRTGPIGMMSYVLPAFHSLWHFDFPALEVEVDGKKMFHADQSIAFVGNIPEYGTGFPILPHARPDDGLLDVCILPARSPRDLFRHALLTMVGEHHRGEGVLYARGKHIRITSSTPAPAQADGDPAGFTPIEIQMLEQRVDFLRPG